MPANVKGTKTRPQNHRHSDALTARAVAAVVNPGIYPDGKGMALHVLPSGAKSWRYRYRIDGKPALATLGTYPEMSLAKARAALEDARAEVKRGRHPIEKKRQAAALAKAELGRTASGVNLGEIADQWFATAKAEPGVWTESTASKTRGRLDNHLKPTGLWTTPIRDVRVADLAALLDALHAHAPDTCSKVRQILSGVFRYAAARGLVDSDPVAMTRPGSGMRKRVSRKGKLPAVTEIMQICAILRRIEMAQASWQVRGALKLIAFTAQRPGRVVSARWSEFDLDGKAPTWTIPREAQKNKDESRGDHVVPLAPVVVAWLRTLPRDGDFVFAASNSIGHVTLEAPSKLLRTSLALAGIHSPHGFRSSFSTLANQESNADGSRRFDRDDIEHVLDHEISSEVVRAYDRRRALPRLRAILEWWAEALIAAKADA